MTRRTPVVKTVDEAAELVRDGDLIGIGGFITTNKPCAILRALARRRVRDLTVVAGPSSFELDLLIGLGMVSRLFVPYVGAEAIAPIAPFFRQDAGRNVDVQEVDLGTVIAMLRAQVQRIPFMPSRIVGTSIVGLNDHVRIVQDPFGGPPVAAVAPIEVDVAIIHASQSDPFGNVQHQGAHFIDRLMAQAAKKVIVQVERVVSNEAIRKAPTDTSLPGQFVDAVVEVPYGAHPMASQNFYRLDSEHLEEYMAAAVACVKGDRTTFDAYVARYVDGPVTHPAYCEAVGMERLFSLGLEGVGA